MTSPTPNVKAIFDQAAEIASPEQRVAYLAEVCAGQPEIRRQVDALLQALSDAGNFLEQSPVVPPESFLLPPTDQYSSSATAVGTVIAGRYKLRQMIGEGGMGTVFMAEQSQPVKRMVALKLVKAGMDTKMVLARFEAERQALALMEHPNIAKVLDAGATESGHPFFVMELVKGVPLTEYCDTHQLSVNDRLQLFKQICYAVQHAHQKNIIHRDLKPSNILVESHDGRPVPKLIDFGLAKAMNALSLTELSLFTKLGSILGTTLYMAPEQAEMSAIDVDRRADIYALGVILYELLTGTTPLEKKRIAQVAINEICRLIKEEEPPIPSARLSSSETQSNVSAQRHSEPGKLSKLVRGDLDWIVMKALAKERDRRYDTANNFAADIEHYLANEPVSALPPTIRYKLRKFLSRNRRPVGVTAVVSAALLVGVVGATWGLFQADQAKRNRAKTAEEIRLERVRAALDKGLLAAMSADFKRAEEATDDAEHANASPEQLRMLRGLISFSQGKTDEAVIHLKEAAALMKESVFVHGMLAYVYGYTGDMVGHHEMLERLGELTPTTPEDFLFKGLAESTIDAAKALRTLDTAFERRPSAVVRLVRADARASYLQQVNPNPIEVELALKDALRAQEDLEDNPAALRISLRAHLVAMGIYKDAGADFLRQYEEAKKQAFKDFEALRDYRHLAEMATIRYYFIREVDTAPLTPKAFEESKESVAKCSEPIVAYNYAQQLYLRKDFEGTIKAMEKTNQADAFAWVTLFAIAEVQGKAAADKFYQTMTAKGLIGWDRYNSILLLLFLGRGNEAKMEAERFLREGKSFPPLRQEQFELAVRFLAGDLNAADYLNDPGMNRADLCNAQLAIGLQRLSEGDRIEAKKHFTQSRALRVFDFLPYDYSSLLLSRMNDNAQWPAWIKPK